MDEDNDHQHDLDEFGRRIKEINQSCITISRLARGLLWAMVAWTLLNGLYWLIDVIQNNVPPTQIFWSHPSFSISIFITVILLLLGLKDYGNVKYIIMGRLRKILNIYKLDCNNDGEIYEASDDIDSDTSDDMDDDVDDNESRI